MRPAFPVFDDGSLLELIELEKSFLEIYPYFALSTPKPMVDIGWMDFKLMNLEGLRRYEMPFALICNRINQPSVQPTVYLRLKELVPMLSMLAVVVHSSLGWSIVPFEKKVARGFLYQGHHTLDGAVFAVREHLQGVLVD